MTDAWTRERFAMIHDALGCENDEGYGCECCPWRKDAYAALEDLYAEIDRLLTRGGIARSLIPASRVAKFHERCQVIEARRALSTTAADVASEEAPVSSPRIGALKSDVA